MPQRSYLFHEIRLAIAGDPLLLYALHRRLGRFEPCNPNDPPDIHFEFLPCSEAADSSVRRPTGRGRAILDPGVGEVLYFESADQLYLDIPGGARAVADPASGRVRVAHGVLDNLELWRLSHFFFTVALAELLKRREYFMVHAAGLARDGRGLLITGDSGSGKTTLALALLRAGFEFLGDDTIFIDNNTQARAFPDEIDITAPTARFFPELAWLAQEPLPGEPPKRSFCATRVYGAAPCWRCAPAVLLFPSPAREAESVLSPLPKDQALVRLACNVLRTELKSSQAHLDALAALVARCRCYRLRTGRDFDRLPVLLRAVLEEESL